MTVTEFILHLLESDSFWEQFSPYEINCGNCQEFASELEDEFPDGQAVWGDEIPSLFPQAFDPSGHCFFEHDGRFFDAESPSGVTNPVELPFYDRIMKHMKISA